MKTDVQLKKDVLDELSWDPAVHAADVGVIVKEGVVTLTGHLASFSQKYAAERAAQRVSGVKAMAVEIDVRLPNSTRRDDVEIATAATHALSWNVVIPHDHVTLKVEKSWVTLSGELEWDYQRKAADRVVRDLVGVMGVTNLIKVKPHVSPIDIQQRVRDALMRQVESDSKQISIAVDGSRVTLSGKVHSWVERKVTQNAAWAAPGVSNVINELSIEF